LDKKSCLCLLTLKCSVKNSNFLGHLNLSKFFLTLVVMLANTQTVEVSRVMHDFFSFLRNFGLIVFSNLLLKNTSFHAYS